MRAGAVGHPFDEGRAQIGARPIRRPQRGGVDRKIVVAIDAQRGNGEAVRVLSTPIAVNAEVECDAEAAVTFARSVKSAAVPPGQTVLEAAESLGVSINYDCRAGICGQCKVKVLSGRVVMEAEDALNAADRANNVILSCQARCIDQVVIDA